MANKNVVIKKRNSANSDWDTVYPVTLAENVMGSGGKSVEANLADIANKQGDLTTLKTSAKSNLVGAVNELFQSADSGKTNIKNKILEVDSSVGIPTDPTFNDLVTAIGNISTGIKYSSGSVTSGSSYNFKDASNNNRSSPYIIIDTSNIAFIPERIIIVPAVHGFNACWNKSNFFNSSPNNYGNHSLLSTVYRIPYVNGTMYFPVGASGDQFNWYAYGGES